MITDIIIMAGGFGERLWPASSSTMPKQFMALNNNISFLQNAILRSLELKINGKIIVVTRKDIEVECTLQCLRLCEKVSNEFRNKILEDLIILSEPFGKHTSAAIMSGVILINKLSNLPTQNVLVMTSDHVIQPINLFIDDCKTASKAAEDGYFVCFSIPPTEPSVGYGYIKTGIDIYNDDTVFKIENFKEKPDYDTAVEYLKSKNYFWNSGMFAFTSNVFLSEMKKCTPEVSSTFISMIDGKMPILGKINNISTVESWLEMKDTYDLVPSIAVDKAIAEKTSKAVAVKSHFTWTDVGSWDTFSELCTEPMNNKVVEVETNNNFVYSDIPVALCGVEDLIVVEKNGQLLIMKKGSSNLVRDAVNKIKE